MMHSDINPGHKVLLSYIISIKEVMEIDQRFSREIQIPHRARRGLRFFTKRNGEIISSPIGIVQHPFGTYDRLKKKER